MKDIDRSPFAGLGKPEPLKHNLSSFWSRKINDEHRLVYTVTDEEMIIIGCKYHYED
ncbi:Txe/YoeB family addiction module toxin [Leptolyngbyaceae cyanobacterium UHCC 1019]